MGTDRYNHSCAPGSGGAKNKTENDLGEKKIIIKNKERKKQNEIITL